ncbi:MAG: hypothetical protein AMQ74_01172 [Candidatus Methanofastidiosum methylothiophilum]|uniref:Uncharacterized protein n=1 Tax=Candidatus Methanofastidiosum methylothiophilum TaxID=1705564 RepID=A0A150J1H9_9EURY|nr:MAG: hypothetical protein AMQ74_01172 [Candidatus Methanofastidiosum methylthiophilus]
MKFFELFASTVHTALTLPAPVIVFIDTGLPSIRTSVSDAVIEISGFTLFKPYFLISRAIIIFSLNDPTSIPIFPALEDSISAIWKSLGSLLLIFDTNTTSSNRSFKGLYKFFIYFISEQYLNY